MIAWSHAWFEQAGNLQKSASAVDVKASMKTWKMNADEDYEEHLGYGGVKTG